MNLSGKSSRLAVLLTAGIYLGGIRTAVAQDDAPDEFTANRPPERQNVSGRAKPRILLMQNPARVPVPPGLISTWSAEGNGWDSTRRHMGLVQNGALYQPGLVGSALSFDGQDDRFSVPDATEFELTQSFSLECWLYIRSIDSDAIIFMRGDNRSGLDPYALSLSKDSHIHFHLGGETDNADIDAPIPIGSWVHVAGTLDDATGAMRIYVNGSQAAEIKTNVRPLRQLFVDQGAGLGFGNAPALPNPAVNFPYHGLIDEFSMYNRALTPQEIQGVFQAGNAGKGAPIRTFPTPHQRPPGDGFGGNFGGGFGFGGGDDGGGGGFGGGDGAGTPPVRRAPRQAPTPSVNPANPPQSTFKTPTAPPFQQAPAAPARPTPPGTLPLPVQPGVQNQPVPAPDWNNDQAVRPPFPTPKGLVAIWTGESDDVDPKDPHDGLQQNGMTFETGMVDSAMSFDGVDDRLSVQDDPAFALTKSLSLEGWLFVKAQTQTGTIFMRGDNRPGLDPYSLTVQPGNILHFQICSETATASVESPLPQNVWVHVAAILDDTAGALRIYLNGRRAAETLTKVRPLGELRADQEPAVGIGNIPALTLKTTNAAFHGLIDEWSLYNRALAPEEIHGIFLAGASGKAQPN